MHVDTNTWSSILLCLSSMLLHHHLGRIDMEDKYRNELRTSLKCNCLKVLQTS